MKRIFFFRPLMALIAAVAVAAACPCAESYGAKPKKKATPKTSAEAKRMQEAAQREITQTKEKIRLNEQEVKAGLSELNRLSADIKTGRVQVAGLQKKVAQLDAQIAALNGTIAANEQELRKMREEYLKSVKKMRLNRKNQSMLAFIFASEDFNQALRRFRYMRQFSKWKERKSAEIGEMVERLGNDRRQLAQTKDAQSVSLAQLSKSQSDLEAKHSRQQRLVEGLRQNGAALQSHLSQKQSEANQLKNSIATLIAQEQAKAEAERKAREKAEAERIAKEKAEKERLAREKAEAERLAQEKAAENSKEEKKKASEAKKEADRLKKAEEKKKKEEEKQRAKERKARKKDKSKTKTTTPAEETAKPNEPRPAAPAASGNFAAMRGKLPRPVDGSWRITNPFGRHSMPELPDVVYDNPGIDAEVAKGATVKAVASGKVSGVYKLAGYGTVVIVNHGEYYTVYGNLSGVNVSVGTQLSAGQSVGSAAADPDDPGKGSVHFELWKGREKQNPEVWLR